MFVRASELRMLDVINVTDGRRLGNVFDLDVDVESGAIRALVVPNRNSTFSLFRQTTDVDIAWDRIVKVGVDVILVELPADTGSPRTQGESFKA